MKPGTLPKRHLKIAYNRKLILRMAAPSIHQKKSPINTLVQLLFMLLLLPEQHEIITDEKEGGSSGRPQNYHSFLASSMSQTDGRFGPPVTLSSSVITSSSITCVPEPSASDTPGANSITNLEQNRLDLPR